MSLAERSLEKRPYSRIETALRTAIASGDEDRARMFAAELERRKASTRAPTPLTPMAAIPEALEPLTEVWLPVPVADFADAYEVSSFGRLRNAQTGKLLRFRLPPRERYIQVKLFRAKAEGGPVTFRLHRLIAGAFVANPRNLPEVNHKDTDRINNHALNLEWVTRKENIAHSIDAGRNTADANPNKVRKLTGDDAAAIRAALRAGEHPKDLAQRYNVDVGHIDRINYNRSHHDHDHTPIRIKRRQTQSARTTSARDTAIAEKVRAKVPVREIAKEYGLRPRAVYNVLYRARARERLLSASADAKGDS